jgi:Tfp pilus assembly protein PilZ
VYERAALIFDSAEDHALGDLSLSLIALGLRPLYATDFDELVLLSREYRSQVGAALLPAGAVGAMLPALRKRVLEPLAPPASAVVTVGEPLIHEVESLRAEGLRFCLRTPYQAHELRYVVARALSDSDPDELRRDSRAPCEIGAGVESEHRRVRARIADLSVRGVFVALSHPHAEGSTVRLTFTLQGHACEVSARVAWCTGADTPPWRDRGMGVELIDVGEDVQELLRQTVAEQVHRFTL